MAKFGEKPAKYDPFSEISSSLATLSEPAAEQTETVEAEPVRPKAPQPKAPVSRQADIPPAAPAKAIEQRQPTVQQRIGSGGGRSNLGSAPAPVAPELALSTTKRFKTTRHEAQRIDQATLRLAAHLGFSVDQSKITRALWDVYLRFEEDIIRSLPNEAPGKRPANYDAVGLAELDERLSEMVGEGLMLACMRHRRER